LESNTKIARTAGVLYLVIIVCAGFSEGVVRSSLFIPENPALTVQNIKESEWLFRIGFVADLVAFMSDLAVSVLLYVLLKPVNSTIALMAMFFRLLAHPAIATVNLLNYFAVLLVAGGTGYMAAFSPKQLQSLSFLFIDLHHTGYLIGGALFGLHCLLLAYLLYRSDLFPRFLGFFIGIAAFGYLVESIGMFLAPGYSEIYQWIVAIPAVIAEVSLCLWLLIKGGRKPAAVGQTTTGKPGMSVT